MIDILSNIMLILASILLIIVIIGMIIFGTLLFIIVSKEFIEEIRKKK